MSKQCLDVHQMKHLQELGLKLKPSLVHYYKIINIDSGKWYLSVTFGDISEDSPTYQYIPAYTLQDVLDALPKDISKDGCTWYASLYIDFENNRIAYGNTDRYGFEIYHEIMIEKDLIDAAYSMLCWAIENKFVETNKKE